MTKDEISKLPKWAQKEVEILQMRLNEAKKELDRINSNAESNTVVGFDTDLIGEKIQYLKNDALITFKMKHGKIRARIVNDSVEINSDSFTGGTFMVLPNASNAVLLKITGGK